MKAKMLKNDNKFKNKKVIIVGGGVTGGTLAWILKRLGAHPVVIESESSIGGIGKSFFMNNLAYEFGPHILHAKKETTINFYKRFGVIPVEYYAKMSIDDTFNGLVDFPYSLDTVFQLPREIGKQVVLDLFNSDKKNVDFNNIETYLSSILGPTLYENYNKGYTRKFWGKDPREIPANGAATWINFRTNDKRLFMEWQGYPEGSFVKFFEDLYRGTEVIHAAFLNLEKTENKITGINTTSGKISGDFVISTISPELIFPELGIMLPYIGKVFVAIEVNKNQIFEKDVGAIYFPNKWRFNRVCEYPIIRDSENHTILGFEFNTFPWDGLELDFLSYEMHCREALKSMEDVEIVNTKVHYEKKIYPIRSEVELKKFESYVKEEERYENFLMTGRLGAFRYVNMNDCIEMAFSKISEYLEIEVSELYSEFEL